MLNRRGGLDHRVYISPRIASRSLPRRRIRLECSFGNLTVSSIYCPPRFSMTKDKFEEFFETLGDRFLACGDYNAKHTYWGSRLINPRGTQLYKALVDSKNCLDVISPGQPTYWPTDPRKIPDLIDFAISRNVDRNSISTEISFDLSSDHSPVIVTYYGKNIPKSPENIPFYKTNWLKYKKFISSHIHTNPNIQCEGEINECVNDFTSLIISALDHSRIEISRKPKMHISNSDIERLLLEKRKLRRVATK